jgi:uncharacterized protein
MPHPKLTMIFVLLAISAVTAADDKYRAEIERDRRDTDEMLRSTRSPLLLVGRFTVKEGTSSTGSDPACTIVLPAKAPAHVGTLTRHGTVISFVPAPGASVSLNGKPVSTYVVLQVPQAPKPADHIGFGDFKFYIRPISSGFTLFLTDAQSPYFKTFTRTRWFAIDAAYRVTARFVPSPQAKTVLVPYTDGGAQSFTLSGNLEFQLAGQTLHLLALQSPGSKSLFIMFQDQTSGKETYGGGRFLEVGMPDNGKTILDFNTASNPYCAYDPYANCPMPLRENRLALPIRAGQKKQLETSVH